MSNIISLESKKPIIPQSRLYTPKASNKELYGKTAAIVDKNESIESAMHRAGILFTAEKAREQWAWNGQVMTGSEFILQRSDNGAKLGNVTERYKPVQPATVVEAWEKIVGTEGWNIKTLGSIDGGKRIWALAETDKQFDVSKVGDTVNTQLLLSTSFDGSSSTIAKFMTMRLVCLNGMVLPNVDGAIKVPHSTNFNVDDVAQRLRIAANIHDQAGIDAQIMAERQVTDELAAEYITRVLAGQQSWEKGDVSTKQKNIIAEVFALYKGNGYGANLASAKGSMWGALNAITQHVDHNTGRTDNSRIRSAYFGAGAKQKQNAYSLALEICAA